MEKIPHVPTAAIYLGPRSAGLTNKGPYQFVLVQAGDAHVGESGLCLTEICRSGKRKG